jgi:hypothetical protein
MHNQPLLRVTIDAPLAISATSDPTPISPTATPSLPPWSPALRRFTDHLQNEVQLVVEIVTQAVEIVTQAVELAVQDAELAVEVDTHADEVEVEGAFQFAQGRINVAKRSVDSKNWDEFEDCPRLFQHFLLLPLCI